MTAAHVVPIDTPDAAVEHAAKVYARVRQREESAALAHGRMLVETFGQGHKYDQEHDETCVALYLAARALEEAREIRGAALRPGRVFEGRAVNGAHRTSDVELFIDGKREGLSAQKPVALAGWLLREVFGDAGMALSAHRFADDHPQLDTDHWKFTDADVRNWADAQH